MLDDRLGGVDEDEDEVPRVGMEVDAGVDGEGLSASLVLLVDDRVPALALTSSKVALVVYGTSEVTFVVFISSEIADGGSGSSGLPLVSFDGRAGLLSFGETDEDILGSVEVLIVGVGVGVGVADASFGEYVVFEDIFCVCCVSSDTLDVDVGVNVDGGLVLWACLKALLRGERGWV